MARRLLMTEVYTHGRVLARARSTSAPIGFRHAAEDDARFESVASSLWRKEDIFVMRCFCRRYSAIFRIRAAKCRRPRRSRHAAAVTRHDAHASRSPSADESTHGDDTLSATRQRFPPRQAHIKLNVFFRLPSWPMMLLAARFARAAYRRHRRRARPAGRWPRRQRPR